MLMLGANAAGYTGDLAVATSGPFYDEVGRTRSAVVTLRTAATVDEGLNYSLSDLDFRIVRYLMPREFYDSLANSLGSGKTYKLWSPNYSVYTGNAVVANRKDCVTSFSISTKSLDYVIGTFRFPNYDTVATPLNTLISSEKALEVGETKATTSS